MKIAKWPFLAALLQDGLQIMTIELIKSNKLGWEC